MDRAGLIQWGDSLEIQTAAAAIKLRAERRMGELLTEMPKQSPGQYQQSAKEQRLQSATVAPSTLADMGIEKTLAHRCQKIASLPEEVFEDYCRERWGMSKQRAFQFMDAAEVVSNLEKSTIVDFLPVTESQARPLAALAPAEQVQAWQTVVDAEGLHRRRLQARVAGDSKARCAGWK